MTRSERFILRSKSEYFLPTPGTHFLKDPTSWSCQPSPEQDALFKYVDKSKSPVCIFCRCVWWSFSWTVLLQAEGICGAGLHICLEKLPEHKKLICQGITSILSPWGAVFLHAGSTQVCDGFSSPAVTCGIAQGRLDHVNMLNIQMIRYLVLFQP